MAKIGRGQSIESFLNWADSVFPGSKRRILTTARVNRKSYNVLISQDGSDGNLGTFPDDLFNFGEPFPQVPYAQGQTPPIVSQNDNEWFDKTLTTILEATAKVIPAYTNYNLQKDAYKIQMERAKQGQEPIDLSRYGTMPIRIQHEIDLEKQRQALTQQFSLDDQTKNTLMIGAGIIGTIFILPKLLQN